ncbi:hypothetical protein FB451DRAFT_46765 [Mycena latifolia]|nr:hypothetical protein FB451DRAFT_46765 [Mycena latifolia]
MSSVLLRLSLGSLWVHSNPRALQTRPITAVMNLSDNGQRSSQSPPVTPPRRASFSPTRNPAHDAPLRHNHLLHRPQQSAVTPQTQSLAHANARLIHERLQQHHNRLQVQLHARPPAPSQVPAGPVKAFLDTTFRAYASRIQTEFNSLRAACARAVQREQHQTAEIRSTCARLAHERDVAEEKLRVLLNRRARAAKRTRAHVEEEEAELKYPPSPVSPPQLPTQSPPPRLLSPFVLAARRSPSHTPDPEDTTGFDLTVACNTLPRPSKRRRVSDSSEDTLVAAGSPGAHPEKDATTTKERETCPPAPDSGECDMDLESESESDGGESSTDAHASSKSKSPSSSRAASRSRSRSAEVERPPKPERVPPPPAPPRLALEYVDIMYTPADGKLICRVCLLAASSSKASAAGGPIQAFVPGASWDMLRTHCEEAHPDACRDVAGLGPAGVRELRRRLGLGMGVQAS